MITLHWPTALWTAGVTTCVLLLIGWALERVEAIRKSR